MGLHQQIESFKRTTFLGAFKMSTSQHMALMDAVQFFSKAKK
jgi:hypothetical protein